MKCQACNSVNPDLDDSPIGNICHACGWEHDSSLELYYQDYSSAEKMRNTIPGSMISHDPHLEWYIVTFPVGFELTKLEREGWSTANGCTPNDHYQKWMDSGCKIKYSYESQDR